MFGYSKSEVIGTNINALIPEPIASAHHEFLVYYIRTGHDVRLPPTGKAIDSEPLMPQNVVVSVFVCRAGDAAKFSHNVCQAP